MTVESGSSSWAAAEVAGSLPHPSHPRREADPAGAILGQKSGAAAWSCSFIISFPRVVGCAPPWHVCEKQGSLECSFHLGSTICVLGPNSSCQDWWQAPLPAELPSAPPPHG